MPLTHTQAVTSQRVLLISQPVLSFIRIALCCMSLQRHRHETAIGKRRYSIQFGAPEIRSYSHPCAYTHNGDQPAIDGIAFWCTCCCVESAQLVFLFAVSFVRCCVCIGVGCDVSKVNRCLESYSLPAQLRLLPSSQPVAIVFVPMNEKSKENCEEYRRRSAEWWIVLRLVCVSLSVCVRATFVTNFLFGLVGAQYVAVCSDKCYYSQLQVVYSCSRSLSTTTTQ